MESTIVIVRSDGESWNAPGKGAARTWSKRRRACTGSTENAKVKELEALGTKAIEVDMESATDIAKAMKGAMCVVSVVAGLRDVIVDAQTVLLEAAIAAGVPRFIPSDFSTDFTPLTPGENGNFDRKSLRYGLRTRASG